MKFDSFSEDLLFSLMSFGEKTDILLNGLSLLKSGFGVTYLSIEDNLFSLLSISKKLLGLSLLKLSALLLLISILDD